MENKYHDPRWQKFRLERLKMAGWQCECCQEKTRKLNIHHLYYIGNRMPWDYPKYTTMVLCDDCHELHHDLSGAHRPDKAQFDKWEIEVASIIERGIKRHLGKRKKVSCVR